MAIRAVIFDLGGVLVRTEDQAPRLELANRLGISREQLYDQIFDSPSARQATLGVITADQHWENVRQALGITLEEFSVARRAFWAGDRLDVDLVDTIRSLRSRYRTALLSNAWSDLRSYLVEYWQIASAFDELIISAEVGFTKPAPAIYRLALDRLNVQPTEAVFVDDFAENIEGARTVGLHTVHFTSADQALSELDILLNGTR